ncbi:MAG TPA: copper resistance protein CopC [Novosphingobium sp.]|jgi:hypothetical protein|nr:copper resistance protein CopC [Novosphingobium sp.]
MKLRSIVLASLLALGLPAASLAHTSVVASTPAAGATVSGPKLVSLTFGEALSPSTTGVAIVMTAMPGMANHGEMIIRNFTQGWSEGNRKLTLSLRQPLRAGSYDLRWQAVGADGHRMTGMVSFTVK